MVPTVGAATGSARQHPPFRNGTDDRALARALAPTFPAGAIGLLSVGEGASSGAAPAERPAGAGDRLPAETPPTMVAHRNCYRNWAALTTTLRFPARAREGGTKTSPAERAADAAPSDTRAANQILDIEAGGGVLDICRPPFSFVLFRLFFFCWSLPTDGADWGRGRS